MYKPKPENKILTLVICTDVFGEWRWQEDINTELFPEMSKMFIPCFCQKDVLTCLVRLNWRVGDSWQDYGWQSTCLWKWRRGPQCHLSKKAVLFGINCLKEQDWAAQLSQHSSLVATQLDQKVLNHWVMHSNQTQLTTLYLENNLIDSGALALSDALKSNTTLTKIDLYGSWCRWCSIIVCCTQSKLSDQYI